MYKGMIEVPWTGQPSGQIPRIKSKYKKPLVITDFGNGRHNLVSGDQGFDVVNAFRSLRLGTAGMNVYLGAGVDAFAIKLPPNSLVTTDTPFWMFVYLAKRNSYTNRYHVSIGSPSGTHYAAIGNFPGNLTGAAESETLRVWSTNILVPSLYLHAFILEYTGAALNLYEDGIFVGSYATSTLIDNARTHFYLGGNTVTINSSVSEKYFGGVFEGSMPSSFPSEFQADPYNTVLEPMLVPMSIPRRPAKRKLWNMSIPFRSDTDTPVSLEPNLASAEGMCFLWSGKFYRNELVTGVRSVNGTATQTVDTQGLVAQCYYNTTNIEWPGQFITTSNGVGTGDFTIMIVANPSVGPGVEYLLSQKNDSAGYPYAQCILLANSDANGNYSPGAACFYTYSGSQVSCAAASQVDGNYHVWMGVRVGTTLQLWRDGSLIASSSGVAQGLVQANRVMNIGSRGYDTSESYRGRALAAAAWNRALTPEEIGKYRSPQEAQALLFKPIDIPVNAGTLVKNRREVGHIELPHNNQPSGPHIQLADNALMKPSFLYIPSLSIDLATNTPANYFEDMNLMATAKGVSLNSGASFADWPLIRWSNGRCPLTVGRPITALFIVYMKHGTPPNSVSGMIFYQGGSTKGNVTVGLNFNANYAPAPGYMVFSTRGDTTSNRRYGAISLPEGYHVVAICWDAASSILWSVDGKTVIGTTNHAGTIPSDHLSDSDSVALNPIQWCQVYLSSVEHRLLSQNDLNALTADPWQIIKPLQIPYDQPALIRQLDPLTPNDGYTPRILLEQ